MTAFPLQKTMAAVIAVANAPESAHGFYKTSALDLAKSLGLDPGKLMKIGYGTRPVTTTHESVVSPLEYPTKLADASYSGISHNGSGRSKMDRDSYVETVQRLYDEAIEKTETEAQRAAVLEAVDKFKREYLKRERQVIAVRSNTYSGYVAGRSKLNARQANAGNDRLSKALNDFYDWVKRASPSIMQAVIDSRSPEQIEAARQAAEEKRIAKERRFDDVMVRLLNFRDGDDFKLGDYMVAKVGTTKDGIPKTVTFKSGQGLYDNKMDLVGSRSLWPTEQALKASYDRAMASGQVVEREKPKAKPKKAAKADEVPPPGALTMTMDEWKNTHRDFKSIIDGQRMAIRDGVMKRVYIVKPEVAATPPQASDFPNAASYHAALADFRKANPPAPRADTEQASSDRRAEIKRELAVLEKQYKQRMNKDSGVVPPSIKSDALNSIARKMSGLDAELKELDAAKSTENPVAAIKTEATISDADYAQVVEAARYLKDIVYSLDNLVGDDQRLLVALSSDLGKSGRDTILMDAFGIDRNLAHTIHNRLDDSKPHKLRAVDMEDAFTTFPMLKTVIDNAKEELRLRDERRAARMKLTSAKTNDDQGTIYYHGSDSATPASGSFTYLTPEKSVASTYGKQVMAYTATVSNTLDLTNMKTARTVFDDVFPDIEDENLAPVGVMIAVRYGEDEIREWAQSRGYDSILLPTTKSMDSMELAAKPALVVFDPKKLKPISAGFDSIDSSAHEAATSPRNYLPEPTDGQKLAGSYKMGRISISGVDIAIENPQGSIRSGIGFDGQRWANTMQHHYGYINGSTGADGDHIDVFVQPGLSEDYDGPVYVIDQIDPETGDFDEHKVIIGATSMQQAKAMYLANYDAGWQGCGDVTMMTWPEFREWIASGDTTGPLGEAIESGYDSATGWIGVDLDGTLAKYKGWKGNQHIGSPVAKMVGRVKAWLKAGKDVRIFTARAADKAAVPPIEAWCEKVFGQKLPVTNKKDSGMVQLWDDRAVSVETNTGRAVTGFDDIRIGGGLSSMLEAITAFDGDGKKAIQLAGMLGIRPSSLSAGGPLDDDLWNYKSDEYFHSARMSDYKAKLKEEGRSKSGYLISNGYQVTPDGEAFVLRPSRNPFRMVEKTTRKPFEFDSEQDAADFAKRLPHGSKVQGPFIDSPDDVPTHNEQLVADAPGGDVDLFGEPILPPEGMGGDLFGDEPAPQHLPIDEIPVHEIGLSADVPQFKSGADDETGVVEPLGGKFDRTGVAPIQLWKRRDGRYEVISGRHRLDLARRSGEKTIPSQVHHEDRGFDARRAAMLDAELNIRDGQGKVRDYIDYFTHSGITEADAEAKGLIARHIGQRAFAIATQGSEDLIAAHKAEIISDQAAADIAGLAPGNAAMQAVGIRAIQEGKPIQTAVNTMRAVMALARESGQVADTMDLFGFDDSALREAEAMAKLSSRKQRQVGEQLAAIKGAAKRPELARKQGVAVDDPEAVRNRVIELTALKQRWDNWSSHSDLLAEIRAEISKPGFDSLNADDHEIPDD